MLNNIFRNIDPLYLDAHNGIQQESLVPTRAKNEKRLRMVGK